MAASPAAAAAAAAAALSILRPPAARSVALKFTPPLHDLRQSSAVLAALRHRFGEVDVFRNLRYDAARPAPGVALAVFRHAHAARRVMRESPVRVRVTLAGTEGRVVACEIEGGGQQQEEERDDGRASRSREEEERGVAFPAEMLGRAAEGAEDEWGSVGRGRREGGGILGLLDGYGVQRQAEGGGRYSRSHQPGAESGADPVQKRGFATSAVAGRYDGSRAAGPHSTLTFTLYAEPSRLDLASRVVKHPCHGPFEVHARTAVARSVAARAPLRGLADLTLRREKLSWKDVNKGRRRVAERGTGGVLGLMDGEGTR